MRVSLKNILTLLLLPVAIMVVGTLGFRFLEDLSFFDAFYLTVTTISTVGYGDIHPTNVGSRIFSIILVIFGIGTFLTIITNVTQLLIQRSQYRLRIRSLNMIVRVFFTEVGNDLLKLFVRFDPNINKIRQNCLLGQNCAEDDFDSLKKKLESYKYVIDSKLIDLETLFELLKDKGDILFRQAENPNLVEHESFSELLWAVIHLRDELISCGSFAKLSNDDIEHLSSDAGRAYGRISRAWVDHLRHLKRSYPYLFSLAVRSNPYNLSSVP